MITIRWGNMDNYKMLNNIVKKMNILNLFFFSHFSLNMFLVTKLKRQLNKTKIISLQKTQFNCYLYLYLSSQYTILNSTFNIFQNNFIIVISANPISITLILTSLNKANIDLRSLLVISYLFVAVVLWSLSCHTWMSCHRHRAWYLTRHSIQTHTADEHLFV